MNFMTIQRCIFLTCKNNVNVNVCKKFSTVISFDKVLIERVLITKSSLQFNYKNLLHTGTIAFNVEKLLNNPIEIKNKSDNGYSAVQLKKRPKKRKSLSTDVGTVNTGIVKALSTSEEYNLESLVQGLNQQQLYEPNIITTSNSCKYMTIILFYTNFR